MRKSEYCIPTKITDPNGLQFLNTIFSPRLVQTCFSYIIIIMRFNNDSPRSSHCNEYKYKAQKNTEYGQFDSFPSIVIAFIRSHQSYLPDRKQQSLEFE